MNINSANDNNSTISQIERLAIETYHAKVEAFEKKKRDREEAEKQYQERLLNKQKTNFDDYFGKDLRDYLEQTGGEWIRMEDRIDEAPKWKLMLKLNTNSNSFYIGEGEYWKSNNDGKQIEVWIEPAPISGWTLVAELFQDRVYQAIKTREDLLAWLGSQLVRCREISRDNRDSGDSRENKNIRSDRSASSTNIFDDDPYEMNCHS